MRRAGGTSGDAAGFTLVEVLVALTLLSLLGVMLSDGLRFGVRAWERTREVSSSVGDIAATQTFLRRRLEGPTRPDRFEGEPEWLRFEALWMADLGAGAFHRFAIRHDAEAAEGGALVLSWSPAEAAGSAVSALSGARVLLGGVDAMAIRYFGALEDDAAPRWRDTWPPDTARPALVHIDVRFADPRRRWPPLIVRPRA
jgi:general secretion pathway protein J